MSHIKSGCIGFVFASLLFTALNLVNDKPVKVTVSEFNCMPEDQQTKAIITIREDGSPFCEKHTKLTDRQQREFTDLIWPMVKDDWNSKK